MAANTYRHRIENMLASADIHIGGSRPWDVHVVNDDIYERVAADGMLGVGEGYMDGWWECDQLDEMICRAFRADFHRQIRPFKYLLFTLNARLSNLQRRRSCVSCRRESTTTLAMTCIAPCSMSE